MKALLALVLGLLALSSSLRADGPYVYFKGNITSISQVEDAPNFYTYTETNYFLLNQNDGSLIRYRTYKLDGVKRSLELATTHFRSAVLPSIKSLKAFVFNYHLNDVNGAYSTFINMKGVPNVATAKAIASVSGAYPPSLSFASQLYYVDPTHFQRIEEKGTLSVLRPLSKAANAGPDTLDQAKARLVAELNRLGY